VATGRIWHLIDKATFEKPGQDSDGFKYVIVGGQFVVREGSCRRAYFQASRFGHQSTPVKLPRGTSTSMMRSCFQNETTGAGSPGPFKRACQYNTRRCRTLSVAIRNSKMCRFCHYAARLLDDCSSGM